MGSSPIVSTNRVICPARWHFLDSSSKDKHRSRGVESITFLGAGMDTFEADLAPFVTWWCSGGRKVRRRSTVDEYVRHLTEGGCPFDHAASTLFAPAGATA